MPGSEAVCQNQYRLWLAVATPEPLKACSAKNIMWQLPKTDAMWRLLSQLGPIVGCCCLHMTGSLVIARGRRVVAISNFRIVGSLIWQWLWGKTHLSRHDRLENCVQFSWDIKSFSTWPLLENITRTSWDILRSHGIPIVQFVPTGDSFLDIVHLCSKRSDVPQFDVVFEYLSYRVTSH